MKLERVYNAYDRTVAFEGLDKECTNFMLDFAFTFSDGRKLYRTWKDEDGNTFYDMGSKVFIYNGTFRK